MMELLILLFIGLIAWNYAWTKIKWQDKLWQKRKKIVQQEILIGISRSKKNSTISPKAYRAMKRGWK